MYKTWGKTTKQMKDIKEGINKWRCTSMFRDREAQYLRCQLIITFNLGHRFINLINKFNTIPVKIPETYFMDTDKLILKFIWRRKRLRTANTVWKNNKVRRLTFPPPGSSVHGVLQARILGWVAMSFLQGILLIWGSNLHLPVTLALRMASLPTESPGKPTCVCVYRQTWAYRQMQTGTS